MKSLLNEISLLVEDMVGKKKLKMLLEIAEDLPDIEADDLITFIQQSLAQE